MCRRKHRTPGDSVSVHCAQPATGVASARWDKDNPPLTGRPNSGSPGRGRLCQSVDTIPKSLVAQLALRCSALDHCATRGPAKTKLKNGKHRNSPHITYLLLFRLAFNENDRSITHLCEFSQVPPKVIYFSLKAALYLTGSTFSLNSSYHICRT